MCRKLTSSFLWGLMLALISAGAADALDLNDPDLVAYWSFNEGAGTVAADLSPNGYNGVLNGGATWTDGIYGSALQFNGSDLMLIAGFAGFPYPDGLVPGTTYYWRVDEVNDLDPNSPWKGDVWSLWIPPKKAYDPSPADGTMFTDQNVTLTWTAGFRAGRLVK